MGELRSKGLERLQRYHAAWKRLQEEEAKSQERFRYIMCLQACLSAVSRFNALMNNLVDLLVVGIVVGLIIGLFLGGKRRLSNVVVGIIGAILGSFLYQQFLSSVLNLSLPSLTLDLNQIVIALIGAIVFLGILKLVKR